MLRNIPNSMSQLDIVLALWRDGWKPFMTFFYAPIDFQTGANLGYAFVDLKDTRSATTFFT
jgi:hypothetical protein